MEALYVEINGQKHCLAGLPNGGIEISIGVTTDRPGWHYQISVYGVNPATEEVSLWPSASLKVGDEIKIVLVDAVEADPPEH